MSATGSCAACTLRTLCLPAGLQASEIDRLEQLVVERRSVRKGETLFYAEDRFSTVFLVKAGSFKTRMRAGDGEQVTGLHLPCDVLGLTGIAGGVLACDAVALEDAQVCVIEFDPLEAFLRTSPALQRQLHQYMSRALLHDQAMLRLLAQATAEERVAAFLLGLVQRQQALGLSPCELLLRMSREEIANMLGLRIETVSRCLSRLHAGGVVDVQGRRLGIRNLDELRRLAHGPALEGDA